MNRNEYLDLCLSLVIWGVACQEFRPDELPELEMNNPEPGIVPTATPQQPLSSEPEPIPMPDFQPATEPQLMYDYTGVPDYCLAQVQRQVRALHQVSATGTADMVFITDTHYQHNSLVSPSILSCLVRNGLTQQVVWGGDAITAYGDIPSEWACHQRDFLDAVAPYAHYYMVRGNHEFTAKDEQTGVGQTYTQQQTASLLSEHTEPDVVRPADDPEACYYYFDNPEQRIRYCVFDTTDSIVSPSLPWCTLTHTSQRQLDWMNHHALHGVPAGYQLVVITHIGVIEQTFSQPGAFEPLHQLLLKAEAPVLMVISGHMHQDFQTYDQDILHVLTGPDALYQDLARSPFMHDVKRQPNHLSAPLLDLVSISADRRTVYLLRIGAGYSRAFHLDAVHLGKSGLQSLPELTWLNPAEVVSWTAYDATGYRMVDGTWDPPCTMLQVTDDQRLLPLRAGSAVLMATDGTGRKEFFNIIID